jgi:hypothetical protein
MKQGGGRVHDRVEVGCYAGGRGDETPRVVLLGGRELTVRVERRWIEEPVGSGGSAHRRRIFQVLHARPRRPPDRGRPIDRRAHLSSVSGWT